MPNAWRVERASQAAVLVDADAYYRALHTTLLRARSQVLLLGWDIDSRLCLRRDLDDEGNRASMLGPFLDGIARRGVNVHLLSWDFVPLFAFERESLSAAELDWKTHRRMRFELDGMHPLGASHHQKVVVVDDVVAFSGGIDLCGARWDTPAHIIDDQRRTDAPSAQHKPFHDVQIAVEGPIAAALGDLARERWKRATGEKLRPPSSPSSSSSSLWPTAVEPDFVDVDVAISRTEPLFEDHVAVHEVERLHLDSIKLGRSCIYMENQYLTSRSISTALSTSLRAASGPEIVIVVPAVCCGWLEERTMGLRRAALLRNLESSDLHGRLSVVAPVLSHKEGTPRLNVHGKVTIVDDTLLRIGSANLSNRSMGLDTECDLSIEATSCDGVVDAGVIRGIRAVRARLLGEHLDVDPAVIQPAIELRGLRGAVAALQGRDRTLVVVHDGDPGLRDVLLPFAVFADPEEPALIDPLTTRGWSGDGPPRRRLRAAVAVVVAAVLCLGLVALWRMTSLSSLIVLPAQLHELLTGPSGPLVGVGVVVGGGLVFFPLTLLVLQSGLVFHPLTALAVNFTGALLSCLLSYGIGRLIGPRALSRVFGRGILRTAARLDGRGVWATAGLRLAPVSPFTLVNLAAGAAHVRLPQFLVGSAVGLSPAIVILTLLGTALGSVIDSVWRVEVAVIVVLAGLVASALAALIVRRRRTMAQTPSLWPAT
ncbi:MAG: VTT domain-containing protein [Deltaproteobacteria bacterium]|nr:VTT domain-containing protein [Deltaproteobacteria bacterium]